MDTTDIPLRNLRPEEEQVLLDEDDEATAVEEIKDEGPLTLATQAFPSLALSCIGLLFAGWLLNIIQYWPVFEHIPQFFVLVPVLLNLKGNLEMTLSSRLSTAANVGTLSKRSTRNSALIGNMVLVQVQAVAVGTVAGCHALLLDGISRNEWSATSALLVVSSSVASAATASFLLGGIMCAVVYICFRMRINPDNIAAPLAAALGDLVTLFLLGIIAGRMYENHRFVGAGVMLAVFLVLLPMAFVYTWRNPLVQPVLIHGWLPLILAMLIASAAGVLLEATVQNYAGMAVVVPVMNGLGGSIAAVYASRRSSFLHAGASENRLVTGVTLFFLQIPVLLVVFFGLMYFGLLNVEWPFVLAMLIVGQIEVAILIPMAHILVELLWSYKMEPDDYALPILTAAGDVIGTGLLIPTYAILVELGYAKRISP